MSNTTALHAGHDRRQDPRRPFRIALALELADRAPIACESLDVSAGGMQVVSASHIPVGPCDVVVISDAADRLVLPGHVVDAVVNTETGDCTARIAFIEKLPAADACIAAFAAVAVAHTHRTRRGAVVIAGIGAIAALIAVGAAGADDDVLVEPKATARAAAPATDRPTFTASTAVAVTTPVTASSVPEPTPDPRATAAVTQPTAPPSAPTSEPAAAPTTRSERADNFVHVRLGSSSDDTAVASSIGPSDGVDLVRVEIIITPEPDGTTLPVGVRVSNRGEDTITFRDGFHATLTATGEGTTANADVVAPGVTEVRPGESVTVDGFLDFGRTGEFDVAADVPITG